jgi:tRNA (cmo5U34)-methyltransferase
MVKKKIDYNDVWTFKSKNIAEHFDDHVAHSVPLYNEIQRMTIELSNFFLRNNDTVLDLGVSTGTTIKNIDRKSPRKNLKFIGVDESEEMLEVAKRNLSGIKNIELIKTDLNYGFDDVKLTGKTISLAISLFTLQFIHLEHREFLLRRIYQALRPGGALILVEKVVGSNAQFNEIMIDLYQDMKIRNGLNPIDNQKKSKSLRGIMSPISVEANELLLRKCGFISIDTIFKWYNFTGFIAIK